jgi:hypothetical protein
MPISTRTGKQPGGIFYWADSRGIGAEWRRGLALRYLWPLLTFLLLEMWKAPPWLIVLAAAAMAAIL